MRLLTPAGIALILAVHCVAEEGPRDVSELLQPIRAKHHLPAMAAAIVTAAGTEAVGVDGVRELGRPEQVTLDDKWHLGSCTKSMTATLLAMFVEEKTLSFETTVGEVFGDVKRMDPAWKPVTLQQLLTNHAGAPANLDAEGLWMRLYGLTCAPADQRRALVEGVLKRPPEAPPGKKYIYSNAGFSIAGAMAETLMKEPWEELVAKRLFGPLGMTSAGFGAPGTKDVRDQPRGHDASGKVYQPGKGADNPAAIGPAGTVHSTIGDWAKFVRFHLAGEKDGGTPGGTKDAKPLLSRASFVKLHTPVADASNYAMGWIVLERPWAKGRALTHSGSNNMWYCVTWFAPDADFGVLVTCNQAGDEAAKACDEACGALIVDHMKHGGK